MTIQQVCSFDKCRHDLLQRFLRSKILFSDNERNAIHESKSVIQHQSFQLAVVGSTPEFALQKSPAYLHFAIRQIEIAVSGASHDPPGLTFDNRECAL